MALGESLQLVHLFETPLIVDTLPNSTELNSELRERIQARRSSNSGVQKSNWMGWQSDTDMMEWGGRAAARLGEHFLGLCNRFTALPPGGTPPFLWYVDMWANVSGSGASNEAHVHPGSVWSAVYYVDDGYAGSEDASLGGDLVLYDPRMPAVRMLPFDLRYRMSDGAPAQSLFSVRPSSGRLLMFPPWILHSVHPYHGSRERISIAMNATTIAGTAA